MSNLASLISDPSILNKLSKGITVVKDSKKYSSQYKDLKLKSSKLKTELKSTSSKLSKYDSKAQKEKLKKILGNVSKTVIPIITMYITNQLTKCLVNNAELEELVETTNDIIDNASTKQEIETSKVYRDKAMITLDNQSSGIEAIQSYVSTLSKTLNAFQIIITIIQSLPVPTSVPPGIGIPLSVITKLVSKLDDAMNIVTGINIVLSIVNPILQRIIDDIEDLKNQLHNINTLFEDKSLDSLTGDEFKELVDSIRSRVNTNLGEYLGYKFILKQEENPAFVVDGNKRHYAVAVDKNGSIVARSDSSFTLEPDVLIEQLKLQINKLK